MKKGIKRLIIALISLILVVAIIFSSVFVLAKMKVIYINNWFVNKNDSTIGVDVSSYQANINMNKLKEQNIQFIYIKATEGSKAQDNTFEKNWDNAKKAGLLSGAYHFFSFDSEGKTQAENFINTVDDNMKGRLIPAVDVEYYGDKKEKPPKKEDVVRELKVFVDALEKEYGVKPIIYSGAEIYDKYLKGEFDEYKKWISSFYTPLSWNYKDDWYIWQYLNQGELEGYSGGEKYIDLNILNKDKKLEDLIVN